MTMVSHRNVTNEDQEVYCCLRNKVVKADASHLAQYCNGCRMFRSFLPEGGIECQWEDMRASSYEVTVTDPYAEWMDNQRRDVRHSFPLDSGGVESDEALAG